MILNAPFDDSPSSQDAFQALSALNLGDLMAESFLSEALLNKISNRLGDDPQQLKRQLEELIHLYAMDKTLGLLGYDAKDGLIVYDSICATLREMFQADACHLFQTTQPDGGVDTLTLTGSSLPLTDEQHWETQFPIAKDWLSEAYRGRGPVACRDVLETDSWRPLLPIQGKTRALLVAPLRDGKQPLGLLLLERHQPSDFTPELLTLADATASLFVTSIGLQQRVSKAQQVIQNDAAWTTADLPRLKTLRGELTQSIGELGLHQQAFVEALADAIDARQAFRQGHSQHAARVARELAEALALNEKAVDLLYYAGRLGALGKQHIAGEVLEKPAALSPQEWDTLRTQPSVGLTLLNHIPFLSEVVPYVQCQWAHWDGSGTPAGLAGRDIPLGSRILAVADAYAAMVQPRPYRGEALTHAEALGLLQEEAGTKWDPAVVATLAQISADALA